jgi:hypothetical protein
MLPPRRRGSISRSVLGWIHFLESHARRMCSHAARPDVESARTLLERIKAGKLPSQFTVRDVYRRDWTGLTEPADAQRAIKLLVEMSCLREKPIETAGRPTRARLYQCSLPAVLRDEDMT